MGFFPCSIHITFPFPPNIRQKEQDVAHKNKQYELEFKLDRREAQKRVKKFKEPLQGLHPTMGEMLQRYATEDRRKKEFWIRDVTHGSGSARAGCGTGEPEHPHYLEAKERKSCNSRNHYNRLKADPKAFNNPG